MKRLGRLVRGFVVASMLINAAFVQDAKGEVGPSPSIEKGETGKRVPAENGASFQDGAWILLALALSYGINTYTSRKHSPEDEE